MILEKLHLENFRSYKDETIVFPRGKILFEGDIGSGKSSILYAIEFALFGLGDLKGDRLIRVGESRCSVELTFDLNGKKYTVGRTLVRKGKGVSQTEGYIIEDGEKRYYSPTELRMKILDLLQFRESVKTKSSSVIFRYAIFTPQEEMKEILNLKPEDRLQTLRRAFGIEDYKIAKDNAKLLINEIKIRRKFLEGEVLDIDQLKKEHEEVIYRIGEISKTLEDLGKEKKDLEKMIDEMHDELKKMEERGMEIKKMRSEVYLLRQQLDDKIRDRDILKEDVEQGRKNLAQYEEELEKLRDVKISAETLETLEMKRKKLMEERERLREEAIVLKNRIDDIKRLIDEKVCPTCKRPIEKGEFEENLKKLEEKYAPLSDNIRKIDGEVEEVEKRIKEAIEVEKIVERRNRLEKLSQELKEKIERDEKRLKDLEEKIESLRKSLEEKENIIKDGEGIVEEMEKLRKDIESSEGRLKDLIGRISSLEGERKTLRERKDKLEKTIEEKMKLKEKINILSEYIAWLQDYFVPSIDIIEKHVLRSINEEFNALFQKWFGMLLETADIDVKIDETFTPIVTQNGYELDINSLSGGERTSIAFAYRLALNLLVRKVCTSLKSNLLILDEPTDGFSKEQLNRVRDVLTELNAEQLILVSHERELEGFADKILYVRKESGISRVEE